MPERLERADHAITISTYSHDGSVPFIFGASCSCGSWRYAPNAWKWTAFAIEGHLTEVGLMNGRGRLRPLAELSDDDR